ncbi:hypothetical protein [Phenylobacterium sp.]|uniref:hypothetical protein n=1 Tax=Phenylobacterium sp. TaxID=1871053 RepID=UPI002F403767
MAAADAADFAFVVDRQLQAPGQGVVDAIAARTGVDERLHLLLRQIRNLACGRPPCLHEDRK